MTDKLPKKDHGKEGLSLDLDKQGLIKASLQGRKKLDNPLEEKTVEEYIKQEDFAEILTEVRAALDKKSLEKIEIDSAFPDSSLKDLQFMFWSDKDPKEAMSINTMVSLAVTQLELSKSIDSHKKHKEVKIKIEKGKVIFTLKDKDGNEETIEVEALKHLTEYQTTIDKILKALPKVLEETLNEYAEKLKITLEKLKAKKLTIEDAKEIQRILVKRLKEAVPEIEQLDKRLMASAPPADAIDAKLDKPVEKSKRLVDENYRERIKKTNENKEIPDEGQDRNTLKTASIEEVRYETRLLNKAKRGEKNPEKVTGLKDETARRIRAYTEGYDESTGWYTINYFQMGKDANGMSHEMHVGLGDILLDHDITHIQVLKKDGTLINATKGVVTKGRRKGRVGFVTAEGKYVGTRTGDKFRIVSPSVTDIKDEKAVSAYVTHKHVAARQTHRKVFVGKVEHRTNVVFDKKDSEKFISDREKSKIYKEESISTIDKTAKTTHIPEKSQGTTRYVVFNGDPKSSAAQSLQERMGDWQADYMLGSRDFLAKGPDASGNSITHQLNTSDKAEQEKLQKELGYKQIDGAYSYKLGNSTFVHIDKVGSDQEAFFAKVAKESSSAVVLIASKETLDKSEKIFESAKEEIEKKKRPFYIITDAGFHSVIGNVINPGHIEKAGQEGKFSGAKSAAVVDMDSSGKITGVYFRTAESSFKRPLTNLRHALAWGDKEKLEEVRKSSGSVTYKEGAKIEGTDITIDVIRAAEAESRRENKTGKIEKQIQKKNFMKLAKFACKEIGLPVYVLLAKLKPESNFIFEPDHYGDSGAALGIGQFHVGAWNSARKHPKFVAIMSQVIEEDPMSIERSRSLLADLLAAAIYLKRGLNSIKGKPGDDPTAITEISDLELEHIVWYYHVPGFRSVILKKENGGKLSTKEEDLYQRAKAFQAKKRSSAKIPGKLGYGTFRDRAKRYKEILGS